MSRRSETQADVPKATRKATRAPKKSKDFYNESAPPPKSANGGAPDTDLPHARPVALSHLSIREDGSIEEVAQASRLSPNLEKVAQASRLSPGLEKVAQASSLSPSLVFSSDSPFIRLYHGNSLELLDAIFDRYGDAGRFDCIFADPPYFLSNGGITCHAGKMVKVDKGDWDKSRGPALNHEFNKEWLLRCQRILKPNGTIWVSGTHHVIFSIGYAMQELGFKILNDIAWEKPNPPPNLSCRYFTHSTETILWAAKNEKSKHTFNYAAMKSITGKQMKTVWRREEFDVEALRCGVRDRPQRSESNSPGRAELPLRPDIRAAQQRSPTGDDLEPVWTMPAPRNEEKAFGKHPTQKPVALVERCLLASTNPGDLVLDPFLGGGTTAIACLRLNRHFIGIELDVAHVILARHRTDREIIELWLRNFKVRVTISVTGRRNACGATASVRAAPQIQFPVGRSCRSALISAKLPLPSPGKNPTRTVAFE